MACWGNTRQSSSLLCQWADTKFVLIKNRDSEETMVVIQWEQPGIKLPASTFESFQIVFLFTWNKWWLQYTHPMVRMFPFFWGEGASVMGWNVRLERKQKMRATQKSNINWSLSQTWAWPSRQSNRVLLLESLLPIFGSAWERGYIESQRKELFLCRKGHQSSIGRFHVVLHEFRRIAKLKNARADSGPQFPRSSIDLVIA